MEQKNKKWFEKFKSKDYDRIIYAESNISYYDLVVLVKEDGDITDYDAIPMPIVAEELYGIKIEGIDSGYLRDSVLVTNGLSYLVNEFITRDEYYERVEAEKVWREHKERLSSLSEEEIQLLREVEEKGLTIATEKNQFGETVAVNYIEGSLEGGFEQHIMNCHSSEWYGMGTCQCVSHRPFVVSPISIDDVLELAKEILSNPA